MTIQIESENESVMNFGTDGRLQARAAFPVMATALLSLSACSPADRLDDVIDFWAETPAHCLNRSGVELGDVSLIVWRDGQPRHAETPVTYKEEMKTEEIFAFSVTNKQEERVGLFTHFKSRPDDLLWADVDMVLTRCK